MRHILKLFIAILIAFQAPLAQAQQADSRLKAIEQFRIEAESLDQEIADLEKIRGTIRFSFSLSADQYELLVTHEETKSALADNYDLVSTAENTLFFAYKRQFAKSHSGLNTAISNRTKEMIIEAAALKKAYLMGLEINGRRSQVLEILAQAKENISKLKTKGYTQSGVAVISSITFVLAGMALVGAAAVSGKIAVLVALPAALALALITSVGSDYAKDRYEIFRQIEIHSRALSKVSGIYLKNNQIATEQISEIMYGVP